MKLKCLLGASDVWILDHCSFPGNETADDLARQAAAAEFIGPKLVTGISSNAAHKTQDCLGLSQNIAISSSLQQTVDRQKCSFRILTDGLHVLLWALAGNICLFSLAYATYWSCSIQQAFDSDENSHRFSVP